MGELEIRAVDTEPAPVATADLDTADDAVAREPAHAMIEPVAVEAIAPDAASESGEVEVHAVAAEPAPVATTADLDTAADAAAREPAHAMIEPVMVEAIAPDAASESGEVEVHAVAENPSPWRRPRTSTPRPMRSRESRPMP